MVSIFSSSWRVTLNKIKQVRLNGIVEFGSHAAVISAANSSYNISIAAIIIGLIGDYRDIRSRYIGH